MEVMRRAAGDTQTLIHTTQFPFFIIYLHVSSHNSPIINTFMVKFLTPTPDFCNSINKELELAVQNILVVIKFQLILMQLSP